MNAPLKKTIPAGNPSRPIKLDDKGRMRIGRYDIGPLTPGNEMYRGIVVLAAALKAFYETTNDMTQQYLLAAIRVVEKNLEIETRAFDKKALPETIANYAQHVWSLTLMIFKKRVSEDPSNANLFNKYVVDLARASHAVESAATTAEGKGAANRHLNELIVTTVRELGYETSPFSHLAKKPVEHAGELARLCDERAQAISARVLTDVIDNSILNPVSTTEESKATMINSSNTVPSSQSAVAQAADQAASGAVLVNNSNVVVNDVAEVKIGKVSFKQLSNPNLSAMQLVSLQHDFTNAVLLYRTNEAEGAGNMSETISKVNGNLGILSSGEMNDTIVFLEGYIAEEIVKAMAALPSAAPLEEEVGQVFSAVVPITKEIHPLFQSMADINAGLESNVPRGDEGTDNAAIDLGNIGADTAGFEAIENGLGKMSAAASEAREAGAKKGKAAAVWLRTKLGITDANAPLVKKIVYGVLGTAVLMGVGFAGYRYVQNRNDGGANGGEVLGG